MVNVNQLIGKYAEEVSPSPFGRWLNGKIISIEHGKLIAEFSIRPEFANPGNILHGGVLAGIMDEVIGITSFSLGREGFFVAINLNVDFLRPGVMGQTLRVESEIIREGKNMLHGECKVFNQENKLIAKATSNLAEVKL